MEKKKSKSPFFVDNTAFVEELRTSNAKDRLTEKAGMMIMRIADGLQSRYTYKSNELKQDVKNTALAIACEVWKSFKTEDVLITIETLTYASNEKNQLIEKIIQSNDENNLNYTINISENLMKTKVDSLSIQPYLYSDIIDLIEVIPSSQFDIKHSLYVDTDADAIIHVQTKYILPNAFSWFTSTVHNGLFQGMNNHTKASIADYSYSTVFEGGI